MSNDPIAAQNPFAAPQSASSSVDDAPIAEGLPLAGRWVRLGAAILDGLIPGVIFFPLGLLMGTISLNPERQPSVPMMMLGALVGLIVTLGVNGWFLHTRGQSVGKMILSIRIVRLDGRRTTGMDTIVKRILPMWLGGSIPGIGPILTLIDVLFIFRQDRRCIHDLIAGTRVMRVTAA